LLYEFALLPSIFLYLVWRSKQPPSAGPLKQGIRVAVITTCVPSKESIEIIQKQLRAMTRVAYPHDSWILDDDGDSRVERLAQKYGVKYFSRKGMLKYNQPHSPFKSKTKAGNVNAWLDHVKENDYEFFVQLDIDHIPKARYLYKTLPYFENSNIAWVQAPSVYKNHDTWTSLGSSEQELGFQGPMQMGFYGATSTPFIIGSHTTYRTKAIRQIGGYQPTRAEDHLDTEVLSSTGWEGVFLPEAIAEGDGPETLNTYLAQQFAWAFSVFQVFLGYSPKLLGKMELKKKLQFIFCQTWYPLWSLSFCIIFFSPTVALISDKKITDLTLRAFLIHYLPIYVGGFLIWWAGHPIMQPNGLRLSWRGMLLHTIRWYVVLKAIISVIFKVKKPYMITPKGKTSDSLSITLKTYLPFITLGSLSVLAVASSSYVHGFYSLPGQTTFALLNAAIMFGICGVDLFQRWKNRERSISFDQHAAFARRPLVRSLNPELVIQPLYLLRKQAEIRVAMAAQTKQLSPGDRFGAFLAFLNKEIYVPSGRYSGRALESE
jgi:cellulose synthase (UDP-forming)